MNDYDSIINDYVEAPASQAAISINDNPDQAVRARQLSRATNQPVLAVYNDLDNAEQEHRAALTRNIVSGNDKLAAYIRGNELADVVSNDDYGNLDNASRAFSDTLDSHPIWGKGIPKRYIAEPLMEGLKGAIYGAAEGFTQEPLKIPENYNAWSKGAYEFLGIPLRGLNAVAGGFMGGAGGLARQAVLAAGGDENSATRAEREARGVVESEMGRGGSGLQHADHAIGQIVRQQEAMALAKPWLDAGVDVPRGVHPLIDQIKEKTNDAWVDKIQTALQEAQNSATRERDPELFKNFAEQHFADAQMGISADAVVRLYGDKVPSREDGILGWVPGIEEKLEAAKTFGEDVHVPLADWVTYVDPQLASELKPDLRAWPGGITKNEAAIKDIAAPAIDGALPQVRTSAALEPMFAIGDRPLKLEKGESIWKGMEDYNFVDHTGKVVGEITIFPDPMKKQLYIASVASHDLQPNTMGPSLIRDILRQLKELYPDYETITGYRISGAREEAGAPKDQRKPVVKLALGDAFELSREYTDLRRILETSPTKFGDVTADLVPSNLWTTHERAIGQAVQEEINRITGKTAEPVLASDIRYEGIDSIRGVYHQAPGEVAKILVNMHDFDATGIARHEAIHHLYREGFFKPEEWNALIEASKNEGWIDRYGIAGRYDHLNELGQHEEAIAEAFRDWAKTRERQPVTPVTTVFQKLWDLMQRIKDRVAKILGREPTFNELFEQAYSGELAKRELAERSQAKIKSDLGVDMPGAMFSVSEEPTKKGFVAYHGSPYEFEKFDSSKIGSGEGAQAYGHGLYFAENEKVAKGYQEKLAKKNQRQAVTNDSTFGNVPILESDSTKPGALYQVHIKSDPAKFLDWDKPLEQQKWIWDKLPEDLKNAIDDMLENRGHNPMSEVLEDYRGRDLYKALEHYDVHESIPAELEGSSWYEGNTTEKIHTAKFLESLGVEGVQYLDGGSRGAGDGTRNFVVFNDKNVEITHKNGEPVNKPPAFAKGESPQEQQLKAEAAGLDAKHKKKIDKLINQEYKENLEAAIKRAEAEQKATQTKEWKEAAKEIRKEVDADIRQRPDVAADLLIGSGELGGKQLERKNYPLRADDLTEAQKASLPRRYYSKDGVPVDMMANLFGFTSGDRLIEELSSYTKSREGMSAQEGLRKTIDEEVQRRMEDKFGKLQDNIMLDAMDQAFSETALNRLAEEWQGAAMQAGIQVIDKNVAKEEALRIFNKRTLKEINPEHLIGIMGKLGRDAERAAIDQRWNDMSVLMQRKYMTGLIVAEARKVQKEMQAAERTFKQFAKREVKSMEPEYTDQVHDIMQRIGKPVKRSVQDLQESIERNGYKNLADFVEQKQDALRVVDAWEPLLSGDWRKDYNSLTVEEFRGVHGTIKNLVHNGKEERKIYRAGEAAEFAELLPQFTGSIKDAAHDNFAKLHKGKYAKLPEQYFVQHIQMETFLNRLDGYDPNGVWFQYVYRNLADGSALVDKWRKYFVNRLKEVEQPENIHRTIDNPLFKDQDTNAPLKFTRRNLIAVMLNTGNSTNLKKMAEGYKLKSDDIMAWVHQHATKKEFDYVQHIWDVFKEIKDQSDTMYRSLSGVAPENIEIRPIDTQYGQYKGGYYPLMRDQNQVGQGPGKVFGKDALTQENFVSAMPAAGYTKKRTGATYPIALEPDMMTAQMSQMIHDIGMRPAIINASKVFMNKEVQSAIRAHFGDAWRHELKDYLVGVANSQNYMPQNQRAPMELAEFVRQNVISTVVGFNPGTVMKHGPTALFLSTKEVGVKNFAKAAWETSIFRNILAEVAPESYRGAVRTLLGINDATSNKAWNFIRENSLEIARRDRNWEETLFGASAGLQPFDQYATWRAKIMQWASKPVALSDMLSATPTWLAAYKEAIAAGKDHGEAVALGDRAVRRAHGSTASTSRTAFQRNYNPYLTSIYNFWSDILNRQVETIWKAGDEAHLTNGNPVSKGLATVPILAGGLFAYSIMPSIIEAYVSPHPHKDDEGFVWKSVKQLMFTQLGGWVGLRDAATAFAFARDPHYGLTGTAWQGLTNLPRDLMKGQPLAKERVGRLIQDGAGLIGTLTGSFPLQIGKSARYLYGVKTGVENPRNTWDWLTGLRFGTNDKHSRSFEQYMKGH